MPLYKRAVATAIPPIDGADEGPSQSLDTEEPDDAPPNLIFDFLSDGDARPPPSAAHPHSYPYLSLEDTIRRIRNGEVGYPDLYPSSPRSTSPSVFDAAAAAAEEYDDLECDWEAMVWGVLLSKKTPGRPGAARYTQVNSPGSASGSGGVGVQGG